MKAKRVCCEHCQNPLARCFCHFVVKTNNRIEPIIWQHPSEAEHPKGTAKLLHSCLRHCRIVTGETLTSTELGLDMKACVLLYPEDSNDTLNQPSPKPVKQLLILDGTWRKSRKILYTNPWLNTLPRVALSTQQSEYAIRKAEAPGQLSTFEAATFALWCLEGDEQYLALQRNVFKPYMTQLQSLVRSQ